MKQFVLVVVSMAVIYAVVQGHRSSVKLKQVYNQLFLLESLRHCPSVKELPLKKPLIWVKQRNAGRNPCDSPYPSIDLHKIKHKSELRPPELSSAKRGIW